MLPDNDVCTRIEHLVNLTLIVIESRACRLAPADPACCRVIRAGVTPM